MNDLLSGDLAEPTFDQNIDYLSELVGDGKKFKTAAELAKGKAEADAFIATLTKKADTDRAEYLELRKRVDAQASLEDLVRQLQAGQQSNTPAPTPNAEVKTPSMDPNELRTIARAEIAQMKAQEMADENFNKVQTKLKEQYGNNFATVLKEQADALRLSKEDINALAMKSPEAFFRVLGLDQPVQRETLQNLPRSSVNTSNFAPRTQKRTWSYYQEMKKNNPTLYRSPQTTVQMHRDSAELGAAFEDGDFHSI